MKAGWVVILTIRRAGGGASHSRARADDQRCGRVPGDRRSPCGRFGGCGRACARPVPEYLEAAAKSMQGEELAVFEATCRETYDRMARISIAPDWARYFDFAASRFPDFLRALTSKE
jgi:hypothetical protein